MHLRRRGSLCADFVPRRGEIPAALFRACDRATRNEKVISAIPELPVCTATYVMRWLGGCLAAPHGEVLRRRHTGGKRVVPPLALVRPAALRAGTEGRGRYGCCLWHTFVHWWKWVTLRWVMQQVDSSQCRWDVKLLSRCRETTHEFGDDIG